MQYEPGSEQTPARPSRSAWLEELLAIPRSVAVLCVRDGRVTAASAAARALFRAPLLGAEALSLFDEGCSDKAAAALSAREAGAWELQVRGEGLPLPVLFFALPPTTGGERVLVALVGTALYSEEAAYKLLAANDQLTNLTREIAKKAGELERARAALEELAAQRKEFITAVSHDLRAPLTALALASRLVERRAHQEDAGDLRDFARRIRRNTAVALGLIENLVEVVRLDAGQLALKARPVSLRELSRETLDMLEPLAAAARVQLALTPDSAEGLVAADSTQLTRVLANVVDNAIRHTPVEGRVEVRVSEEGDVVRCAVSDTGPGVPLAERQTVFERFRQGQRRGSLGLGLYVARQLIEMHGGRIWVEDRPGGGACFAFALPRWRDG